MIVFTPPADDPSGGGWGLGDMLDRFRGGGGVSDEDRAASGARRSPFAKD